jgi:hypothetical protein
MIGQSLIMKPRKYDSALCFVVSPKQRAVVQKLADQEQESLGKVARDLLNAGIKARGLTA